MEVKQSRVVVSDRQPRRIDDPGKSMSQLEKIASAVGSRACSVIFVHGLGGDLFDTWCRASDRANLWPLWLAEDFDDLDIYSVGYDTSVSRWRGTAMHLPDRARNILERLLAEPDLAIGSLVFVGHSLGGLVIKELLRIAEAEGRFREDANSLISRVQKVAFLATPHAGAGLATVGDRLRILAQPSAATACLVRNDPSLRALNIWYRDWARVRNMRNLILAETIPMKILGMVVTPDSSDPGIAGANPIPVDSNHVDICKPTNRKHEVYVHLRSFVERAVTDDGRYRRTSVDSIQMQAIHAQEQLTKIVLSGILPDTENRRIVRSLQKAALAARKQKDES